MKPKMSRKWPKNVYREQPYSVTLSIVMPTYQSDTTGQTLTIIAHLLKL
jgi:hypothetical protein